MTIKPNKTVGGIADQLYRLREKRQKVQREVDAIKRQEFELTEVAKTKLREAKLERASGKVGTISRKTTTVAKVTDWDAFYQDVAKRGAFDVLFRRVNNGVYSEIIEETGKPIAGSQPEHVVKLSLSKATR